MSAPELKPCPFCGGEARYQIDHTTEERNSVWCGKCDFGMFDPDDTGSVVTAWNTRADLAPAALAEAEARAYARGLEDAAAVAERQMLPCDIGGDLCIDPYSSEVIATAIRALAQKEAKP